MRYTKCVTEDRFMSAVSIFKKCKYRWKMLTGCKQAVEEPGSFCLKDWCKIFIYCKNVTVFAVAWFEWCA